MKERPIYTIFLSKNVKQGGKSAGYQGTRSDKPGLVDAPKSLSKPSTPQIAQFTAGYRGIGRRFIESREERVACGKNPPLPQSTLNLVALALDEWLVVTARDWAQEVILLANSSSH